MKDSDKIDPHVAALHGDYKYIKMCLQKQEQKIEKLVAFVSYYANCPCCNQDEECIEDCTFEDDDPNAYDVMQQAREVLK